MKGSRRKKGPERDQPDVMSPETGRRSELDQRSGEILRMVVDGFIRHAQPISSMYITENYPIGLSSATVRSIFATLEKEGFLYSPHRSSGRVPTEPGYRYYVENLPSTRHLQEEEQRLIQQEYLRRDFNINDILDETARLLSTITRYASVVMGPVPAQAVLKHVELIDMGEDEVLVILVTRAGTVLSRSVFLENRVPGDYLREISRQLNYLFKGMDLAEMREQLVRGQNSVMGPSRYFPMIARTIAENFDSVQGKEQLFVHGIENLMNNIANEPGIRMSEVGHLLESKEIFRTLLKDIMVGEGVEVFIEGDHDNRLTGLSIVAGSYKMGEKKIGSLGVIGPNRMDYLRVVSSVDYIRRVVSNLITRMSN